MFEGWSPDPQSEDALYLQIYEYIKGEIFMGRLPIGSKLPPQRELSRQFGVNRSTVVTAMELLAADDLVKANGKGGTQVSNNAASLNAPPPPNWTDYIHSGSQKPNAAAAQLIDANEHRPDVIAFTRPELSKELFLPEVLDSLRTHDFIAPDSLGYGLPHGSEALREELCRYYGTLGVRADPDQILITSGALQALYLIASGILYGGSSILTEAQSYIYSVNIFQSAGMRLCGVPMDKRGLLPAALEKARLQTNASILYTIPNFNNPTGALMDEERQNEIYSVCQNGKLPIIEDDTYREIYFAARPPRPLKALDTNELVLLAGSCSKVLFPGFRLGWIIGNKAVVDRLADVKMQMDLGANALSQNIFCFMLKEGLYGRHLAYIRGELKKRRDFMLEILANDFSGLCRWNRPAGGVFINLEFDASVSVQRLFRLCLDNGLLFCTGDMYANRPLKSARLAYSYLQPPEIEKGLAVLKKCLLKCSDICSLTGSR